MSIPLTAVASTHMNHHHLVNKGGMSGESRMHVLLCICPAWLPAISANHNLDLKSDEIMQKVCG